MDRPAPSPPDRGDAEPSTEPGEHVGVRWFGQQAGPAHLPSLTGAELHRTLEQLHDWVSTLIDRFAIDARMIPPCWEQHNGMVEALQALRDYERACYTPKASPAAAVEWFRAFRDIEARLVGLAALTHCTAHEHRLPPRAVAPVSGIDRAPDEGPLRG